MLNRCRRLWITAAIGIAIRGEDDLYDVGDGLVGRFVSSRCLGVRTLYCIGCRIDGENGADAAKQDAQRRPYHRLQGVEGKGTQGEKPLRIRDDQSVAQQQPGKEQP